MADGDNQDQGSSALVTVGQNVVNKLATLSLDQNANASASLAIGSGILTAILAIGTDLATINTTINSKFPNWVTAPANSTASGVSGQVAYAGDGNTTSYFYVCFTSGSAGVARWGRFQAALGF